MISKEKLVALQLQVYRKILIEGCKKNNVSKKVYNNLLKHEMNDKNNIKE